MAAKTRTPRARLTRARAARRISVPICAGLLRGCEFAILALIGLAIGWLDHNAALPVLTLVAAAMGAAATVLAGTLNLYSLAALRSPRDHLARFAVVWVLAALVAATSMRLLDVADVSFDHIVFWCACGAAAATLLRIGLARQLGKWQREGRLQRRALVYGTGPDCDALIAAIDANPTSDIRIAGIYDDRSRERQQVTRRHRRLGDFEQLLDTLRRDLADLVIITLPIATEQRLGSLVDRLSVLPVDVRAPASASKLRFGRRVYSWAGGVPMIDLGDRPLSDWDRLRKAAFDRIVAGLALVVLAPVMALVAIAVKATSRGPVLFRQTRLGFNNQPIEIFKFRSMYTDRCDTAAAQLVTRNDCRVTPVGRFIRRTSLDELPQLFNVLRGELSLVGPRPHALEAKAGDRLYHDVVRDYCARHRMKPGITGWAQVHGWRGETDTAEKLHKRVEHDLYYIDNWSLLLDLEILLRTPLALLKAKNAY